MRKTAFGAILCSVSAIAMLPGMSMAQEPTSLGLYGTAQSQAETVNQAQHMAIPDATSQSPSLGSLPSGVAAVAQPSPRVPSATAAPALGVEPVIEPASSANPVGILPISETAIVSVEPVEMTSTSPAKGVDEKSVAEKAMERFLPENMDVMSADLVRSIDADDFIQSRMKIGLDIKMMEEELKRIQGIEKLIDVMGIQAFSAAYPDLYLAMQDSPALLSAQIRRQELLNDLEEAMTKPEDKEEESEKVASAPVRDDGSSFFIMPSSAPAISQDAGDGIPPAINPQDAEDQDPADLLAAEIIEPEEIDAPISLREIYGIGGKFYAVIMHGDEKIRISKGDVLPGDTEILNVGDGFIDIIRRGSEIRIRIQG